MVVRRAARPPPHRAAAAVATQLKLSPRHNHHRVALQPSNRLHRPSIHSSIMEVEEFRVRGKEMVDYICTYMTTLNNRRVTPSVEPGYLRAALPADPPLHPESWDEVMHDVESKIMPGVTHWQHPRFHAYFPSGNSFPSILGDMLSAGIGCIGFSWVGW